MKYRVRIGDRMHDVVLEGDTAVIDGETLRVHLAEVPGSPIRMVTVGDAPASKLIPSAANEGAIVRAFEEMEPGAIVIEEGVLAGVVLGMNSKALILKGCSKVVLNAPPPITLSAVKITFCPLPGSVASVKVPAKSLEKLVRSGGPTTTVFQAVLLAPPFQ